MQASKASCGKGHGIARFNGVDRIIAKNRLDHPMHEARGKRAFTHVGLVMAGDGCQTRERRFFRMEQFFGNFGDRPVDVGIVINAQTALDHKRQLYCDLLASLGGFGYPCSF